MDMQWYEFADETRERIVASYSAPQLPSSKPIEQLAESDPRVQRYLGPEWARAKYQEYTISSLDDLLTALRMTSMLPKYAFRGQANSDWSLETPLERGMDPVFVRQLGLGRFEQRVIIEAKRRGQHYFDQVPGERDTLGWLAFLRHHGVPTRLLDATWSIFVATFFAVSDRGNDVDAAVWAFNQGQLHQGLWSSLLSQKDKLFYKPGYGGALLDSYQPPTVARGEEQARAVTLTDILRTGGVDKNLLLDLSIQDALALSSVTVVEPLWVSKRLDAQQGAFLLPLDLRRGFMQNLQDTIGAELKSAERRPVSEISADRDTLGKICINAGVIKFIIPAEYCSEIAGALGSMNIRKIVLFPDVTGYVGLLSDLIPKGVKWPTE